MGNSNFKITKVRPLLLDMKHQAKPLLLIFPFGLLSHYLRCLVLARHLSPYFKIKFAGHPEYNHFVEKEGFAFFDSIYMDEKEVMQDVNDFNFSWLNEKDLEISFRSQATAIENLKPMAVLGDAVPSLKMAAEYTGVHYISLINSYMSRHYAHVRNISRTHPAYPFVSKLPAALKKFLITQGEAMAFRQVHKPFKELRTKYNLKPVNHYLSEIEGDRTLLCDMQCIFPTQALPGSFISIGPLIYSGGFQKSKLPCISPDKKTIYVSMGSTGNWKNVLFLNDPFYSKFNVITASDKENILDAPHITKTAFLDVRDFFPAVDLVICHGGNGTIYQALQYGIPLLCKTAHFEQEWNVAGLQNAGLALSLDDITDEGRLKHIINNWITYKQESRYKEIIQDIDSTTALVAGKAAIIAQQINYDTLTLENHVQHLNL